MFLLISFCFRAIQELRRGVVFPFLDRFRPCQEEVRWVWGCPLQARILDEEAQEDGGVHRVIEDIKSRFKESLRTSIKKMAKELNVSLGLWNLGRLKEQSLHHPSQQCGCPEGHRGEGVSQHVGGLREEDILPLQAQDRGHAGRRRRSF